MVQKALSISNFLGIYYISNTGVVLLFHLGWQRSLQRWKGPETCPAALARGGKNRKLMSHCYSNDAIVHPKLDFQLICDCQIDPRHRYGHNLHFYYHRWLHCQSKQPFFYWYRHQQNCSDHVSEPNEQHSYWVLMILWLFWQVGCRWRERCQLRGALP